LVSVKHWHPLVRGLPVLSILWLVESVGDRIWFALDHHMPSWDQAEYLTGALNYWQALQAPQWFSADWWISLWQLSSKIPPLVYISTAPFLSLFGAGPDQSTLINLLYSAILLSSVYVLGAFLFTVPVGLWAAGLCLLLPGLYRVRLDYLLDYPLAAMVTLSFTCLTVWRVRARSSGKWGMGPEERGEGDQKIDQGFWVMVRDRRLPRALRLPPDAAQEWLLALAFGVTFGLALMVKQPALLFLLVPLITAGVETLWQRRWMRLVQLVVAVGVSSLVFGFWFRTNWLLALSAGKRATVDSAIAEGDPSLLSLDAWTFYLKILPGMVSLPLLLVGLAGIVLFWRRSRVSCRWLDQPDYAPMTRDYRQQIYAASQRSLSWLLIFCVGGYLFSSLNINKDDRYVVPYLPVLAVILAYGFTLLPKRWRLVQWSAVGLSLVLMICNLFPLNLPGVDVLRNPISYHPTYLGAEYPYAQVAAEVIQTQPYQRSTMGVLPSTVELNQHNINYYGNLANFQVYGRQVGTRLRHVKQDARSLPWFITKTGAQGSIRKQDAHDAIVQLIEQGKDFQLHKTWSLPDGSKLNLFRRRLPLLEVKQASVEIGVGEGAEGVGEAGGAGEAKGAGEAEGAGEAKGAEAAKGANSFPTVRSPLPVPPAKTQNSKLKTQNSPLRSTSPLHLDQVIVPKTAPPGAPLPVTYRWSGPWSELRSGLVLLTWHRQDKSAQGATRWFHDHGIGMGSLYFDLPDSKSHSPQVSKQHGLTKQELPTSSSSRASAPAAPPASRYQVVERMAMQPPKNLVAGTYTLEATYLNRETGETAAIAVPPVSLRIDPTAPPLPAPELDWVTQLRSLAMALPQGIKGLNLAFDEIGRINQYDPMQDYVNQTRQAMEYRLQQEPKNRDFAYALALANVLKRRVIPAIAGMQKVAQLDAKNPYAYGYLAFVNLYDFRPGAAQAALSTALKLNPNLPELQALSGVAALMQGNLVQAWHYAQAYRSVEDRRGKE
jgi:4-amino-4-deoxy-L-arabinose transferase-like glycosyltransferase